MPVAASRSPPFSPTASAALIEDRSQWKKLPDQVREWLEMQELKSTLPRRDQLLIETFPRGEQFYMVVYSFEGRLAHQTLGMLLTRRLERAGARPVGFVATDYALCIWASTDLGHRFMIEKPDLSALFDADMLGDDLDAWLDESYLLKRTFRACALISGLVEKKRRRCRQDRPPGDGPPPI